MTSAYFASFVNLPVIIREPGKYVTRNGQTVIIEEVSSRHDFGCRGSYDGIIPEQWHKSGRLYKGVLSNNDIVRMID